MRTVSPALLAGLAVVTIAGMARSAPPEAPAKANEICLLASRIDHTHAPNDHELLFYMKSGKVWRNTLQRRCHGLERFNAIRWDIRGDTICAGKQAFTIIANRNTCVLGAFTPYTPPQKPKHD